MKLMVSYLIGEEKKIVLIKNKRIRTREDVTNMERLIETKTGVSGVKIVNWKIIGTNEEKMRKI